MIYIQHRVNTMAQLASLEDGLGAEIDLRSDVARPGHIHLQHDPWKLGEAFEPWLDLWAKRPRGPLILNTKEDALEATALAALAARNITDFFFLDTTLPTLVALSSKQLGAHLALRLSSMEPLGSLTPWLAKRAGERPKYVWVDCFKHVPLAASTLQPLIGHFSPCLVSPDLQGDLPMQSLPQFVDIARLCSLICTKQPPLWQKAL